MPVASRIGVGVRRSAIIASREYSGAPLSDLEREEKDGRRATLTLLMGLLLSFSGSAHAHDHEPPKTRLVSATTTQRGQLGTYCWTRATGEPGLFGTQCVDTTQDFPRARPAWSGRKARVRLYKAQIPKQLRIHRWREVERNGTPRGPGQSVSHELVKRTVDGDVIYDAVFRLPHRKGHLYLEIFGKWDDVEGSANDQDAVWTFHLTLE